MLKQIFQRNAQSNDDGEAIFPSKLSASDIRLTPSASERMCQLTAAMQGEELNAVRVFVMGGGCGGMTYGMTYATEITAFDAVLEGDGYRLAVDSVALNYLQGCTIDFTKQGLNESFVFKDVFQRVGGSGGCSGCAASGGGTY